jgi:hypothetical protein
MKEAKILMGPQSYRLIELSNLVGAFQPLHKLASGGELRVSEVEARRLGIAL